MTAIKVVHRKLGVLLGEVLDHNGRNLLVKLAVFDEPAWVDQKFVSEADDVLGDNRELQSGLSDSPRADNQHAV